MSDPLRVALIGFRTAEHGQLLDLFGAALKLFAGLLLP